VTLQKYFSNPSFTFFFSNLTHKTETGTANRWETPNSKHLDQSIFLANQKQGAVNKCNLIVFIRLFQGSSGALKALHSSGSQQSSSESHWMWLLYLIKDFQCRVTYWAPVEMLLHMKLYITPSYWINIQSIVTVTWLFVEKKLWMWSHYTPMGIWLKYC
jgi:hypothetical protein